MRGPCCTTPPTPPPPPIQCDEENKYVIAGANVEASFHSLKDVECARMAADAVMQSSATFEGVNYDLALKYLLIVGGESHLKECGLNGYIPTWLGGRPDLLTVGGEGFDEDSKWGNVGKQLPSLIQRRIISKVIEVAVIICMGTHVYSFGEKIFLQCKGGPIGMRFTASLANLIMKIWDQKWLELLRREGINHLMYVRYVDDCRLVVPLITKG